MPRSPRTWLTLVAAPLLLALQVEGMCAWLGPCLAARASEPAGFTASPVCPAHATTAPSVRFESGECCAWLGAPPPAEAPYPRSSVPPVAGVAATSTLEPVGDVASFFGSLRPTELPRGRPVSARLSELGVLLL